MSHASARAGAIIVGASLVLSACGSSPVGPVPERLLSEVWEWQSACCGIAGDTRTPTTEGLSYVLRFRESGIVRAERNGTVVQETTFRVRRVSPVDFVSPVDSADEFTEITYGEPLTPGPGIEPTSRHMLTLPEDGRLLLSNLDACADCFGDWVFLPRLE